MCKISFLENVSVTGSVSFVHLSEDGDILSLKRRFIYFEHGAVVEVQRLNDIECGTLLSCPVECIMAFT